MGEVVLERRQDLAVHVQGEQLLASQLEPPHQVGDVLDAIAEAAADVERRVEAAVVEGRYGRRALHQLIALVAQASASKTNDDQQRKPCRVSVSRELSDRPHGSDVRGVSVS